jgi:ankyrin repeat protein
MTIRNILMVMVLAVMGSSCDWRVEPAVPSASKTVADRQTALEREILFRENGRDKDHYFGYTPLILAARAGDVADVEKLLKENNEDINWKMQWGLTALMWAADQGHVSVVKLLLEKGAKVNVQCEDGLTALMFAAREGRTDTVKILLESKAQIMIKDPNGKTAEVLARENGHNALARLIHDAYSK